jgi:hypothetical protein
MNMIVTNFKNVVKGVLNGFDRIVFKGYLRPLMNASGVTRFCKNHGILNKDYKSWMMEQTEQIVSDATHYAKDNCGRGIMPLSYSDIRKEKMVHGIQEEQGIKSGLIGVFSAIEACSSFKAQYCAQTGYPRLQKVWTKCKHLYFYFDHPQYGFMNIRLQTWFPYHVQICLNGREWLRRGLEDAGVDFVSRRNKFFHIDGYDMAQRLLDQQLDTRWEDMLAGFTGEVFPARTTIIGSYPSYYWTLWQSEWATDIIFASPKNIAPLMDSLLRHAFMTGTSERVLRYMDRPLKQDGTPRLDNHDEVLSNLHEYGDGARVRHWVNGNSVKCYNELNDLRVETTMNQPSMFRVYRHAQEQHRDEPKRLLPLRKGVADIVLRTQVSQEVNNRFMDNLATAQCHTPVRDVLDKVVKPFKKDGRRIRGLEPTGKDLALLQAISDPAFCVGGLDNRVLREKLTGKPGYDNRTTKQLSAKISRQLRLLRNHGLLRKLPRQKKYVLTQKGRELTMAINAMLAASIQQLMEFAA